MTAKKLYLLAALLALLGAIVGFAWAVSLTRPATTRPASPITQPKANVPTILPRLPEGVVCTQDAKLCPDGSYVARSGPKCEFAPCPQSLPKGYTLDSYDVAEITGEACLQASDCVTPPDYLARSNCPYTSLCLQNKCAVVCPKHQAPKP
jgi:hypothetical protein